MKRHIKWRKIVSYALVSAMVFSQFSGAGLSLQVKAATYDRANDELGTQMIANPDSDNGGGWSYVYFGNYNGNPMKYRVLSNRTTEYGDTTMLLDSDRVLFSQKYDDGRKNEDINYDKHNNWLRCGARNYLNTTFLNDDSIFNSAERDAIAASTITKTGGDASGKFHYTGLSEDKLFLLDMSDLINPELGYLDEDSVRIKKNTNNINDKWFIRTEQRNYPTYVAFTGVDGVFMSEQYAVTTAGISPALNLDLSNVIYTGCTNGTAGEFGAEYKLTLKDDNINVVNTSVVTINNDTVTVPYSISGADVGEVSQISVILTDGEWSEDGWSENATKKFYATKEITGPADLTSTFSFDLPSDYVERWNAYVVAEDVNASDEEDYASEPLEINIPVTIPPLAKELTYTGESQVLVEEGSAIYGTMVYAIGESNETAPSSQSFSEELPKRTDADTYYVWYMVKGDGSHPDSDPICIEVTMAKANLTSADYRIPTGLNVTYGKTLAAVTLPSGWVWDDNSTSVGNVGERYFSATYTKNSNYYPITKDVLVNIVPVNKSALYAAIGRANVIVNNHAGSDYATIVGNLQTAITAADSVYQENNVLEDDVEQATTDLNTAIGVAEAAIKEIDDTNAANAVKDKINALPALSDITVSSRAVIEDARTSYEALTNDQKGKIDTATLNKLVAAEAKLAQVQEIADRAAFAEEKENAKTTASGMEQTEDTDALKELISNAMDAIDELEFDAGKTLAQNIAAINQILSDLENNLNTGRDSANSAAAGAVIAKINAIPAVEAIQVSDKDVIEEARRAYDALTGAQRALISSITLKKLTDSEARLAEVLEMTDREAFETAKGRAKNALAELETEEDGAVVKEIIRIGTEYINDLTYDTTKSLSLNLAALDAVSANYAGMIEKLRDVVNVEAVSVVKSKIEAIPAIDDITIEDREVIEDARKAYNALTNTQKRLVETATLDALEEAEDKLIEVQEVADRNDFAQAKENAKESVRAKERDGDSDASKALIASAVNDIDVLTFDANKTLAENIAAINTIVTTLDNALTQNRNAEAVGDVETVLDQIGKLPALEDISVSDQETIEKARKEYENLTDEEKSQIDPNELQKLIDAENRLKELQDAANRNEFAKAKASAKASARGMEAEYNDKISDAFITVAEYNIDLLAYDSNKTLDQNKEALHLILTNLETSLLNLRDMNDEGAVDLVSDLISALPSLDSITPADKEVIEKAKEAYESLTDEQKAKVDPDVLEKLKDAEEKLKEVEKIAEEKEEAKKKAEEAKKKAQDAAAKAEAQKQALLAAAKNDAVIALSDAVKVTQKGKKLLVTWKKAKYADGYDVYAAYSNKKFAIVKTVNKGKLVKVNITKFGKKKLDFKQIFKVYVSAYKMVDGKKVILANSMPGFLAGSANKKFTNAKKLKVTKGKLVVK
ncbi:MAG: DUF6273 domain-containing protein, partial [Lachnospiraceae bacterium]|nr:DUF6273 domain-containing protein [Lachnospiraceae bacterium]